MAEPPRRSSPAARKDNGMMDLFGQPEWIVAGCAILVALAFAAREVMAGALRAAGDDLWQWIKRRGGH